MVIVSMDIRIEQYELDQIMDRYPLFEYGKDHWDRNRIYFRDKNISKRQLEFDNEGIDVVRVSTPAGYIQFRLLKDITGGVLSIASSRFQPEFYYQMFDLGLEIKSKYFPDEVVHFHRMWTINKIADD